MQELKNMGFDGNIYEDRKKRYIDELRLYLDKDFDKKFDNERLSRESELIIGHELLAAGYQLKKKEIGIRGPDFLFEYNGQKVWVEVIATREGEHPKHKNNGETFDSKGAVIEDFKEWDIDNCKLNIAGSISNKTKQFNEYVKDGVVLESYIKIICVNVKNFGLDSKSCPFIASVVYGLEEIWWVNTKTYDCGIDFGRQKPIVKKTGKEIDMGLFAQDGYTNIDGALWFNYGLGTAMPGNCEIQFYANHNRKSRIGDLFNCWQRVFYENGVLLTE